MDRRTFLKTAALLGAAGLQRPPVAWTDGEAALAAIQMLLAGNPALHYFETRFGLRLSDIYWGDLHNHSSFSQDAGQHCSGATVLGPANALDYARYEAGLDFVALTDHAELRTTDADQWNIYLNIAREKNDETAFLVFPGFEYTNTKGLAPLGGSTQGYGHKHVLFQDFDQTPEQMIGAFDTSVPRKIEVADTCEDLWRSLRDKGHVRTDVPTAATLIHTPAMTGDGDDSKNHETDFDVPLDKDLVRTIEIYSKWGNSEGEPVEAGGVADETLIDYDAANQVASKTIRSLLKKRWVDQGDIAYCLGFTGSTDNHRGRPGNHDPSECIWTYRGGVTGIVSPRFSRADLRTALYRRRTMAATSDCRTGILLAVESGDRHLFMGEQGTHDGRLRVRVATARHVTRIELVLDGRPFDLVEGHWLDKTYTVTAGERHYLYARAVATGADGATQVTWSSPVYLGDPA